MYQNEDFFLSQDLWDVIERGLPAPEEGSFEVVLEKNEKQKDGEVLFVLQQGVSDGIFSRLTRATSSK